MNALQLKRGAIYLDAAVFERFFPGRETVVLLRDQTHLLILPVRHAAAGGFLVKRRNRAGDRVVDAADFFRSQGLDDEIELSREMVWSDERGGVVVEDVFR